MPAFSHLATRPSLAWTRRLAGSAEGHTLALYALVLALELCELCLEPLLLKAPVVLALDVCSTCADGGIAAVHEEGVFLRERGCFVCEGARSSQFVFAVGIGFWSAWEVGRCEEVEGEGRTATSEEQAMNTRWLLGIMSVWYVLATERRSGIAGGEHEQCGPRTEGL
ncbi:hypothetical protein BD311DRAFT_746990 [Dichomitus squalens]|uniref:Uncharacterized protein n=1 Tax=Dichomitus squalens TaxID=114155 RepID=A0A4Q9N5A7_9APHY|nr:hypothetical protein BD311DRAFT_746990 [Dichomitus squalens]